MNDEYSLLWLQEDAPRMGLQHLPGAALEESILVRLLSLQ
jgi:hypothetical protein